MVIVVVLLAAFHKFIGERHRAGAIQAVVDLPGTVMFLGIAQLVRDEWAIFEIKVGLV